jgi:Ser/Thr protein kinase RdoA (MazF antagonist)
MTPASWTELAACFNLGEVRGIPRYITRGAMGEIWQLHTSTGRWAVKWLFPWNSAEPRPADVQLQFAAAAAGITLPLPVLTRAGDAVATLGDRHARVYAWADLGPACELPADPRTAAEAGRLLGLLHALSLEPTEPDDPWYTQAPPVQDWAALAERAEAAGMSWAARLATAHARIAQLTNLAAAGQPAGGGRRIVCHRDFNPENVIPAASGDHLVVMDWETAGPMDPGLELGYALFAWSAGQGQISAPSMQAFLDSYVAVSGAAPVLGPGLFTTAVAVPLNFLKGMAEQAIDEPEHRDYAEKQIYGLLDHDLDDVARFVELSAELLGSRRGK